MTNPQYTSGCFASFPDWLVAYKERDSYILAIPILLIEFAVGVKMRADESDTQFAFKEEDFPVRSYADCHGAGNLAI